MSDKTFEHSAALADHEKEEARKRLEKLSEVANKIEAILIDADCSWGEWHQVVEIFNRRNEMVIPQIKIKEIKKRYEQQ